MKLVFVFGTNCDSDLSSELQLDLYFIYRNCKVPLASEHIPYRWPVGAMLL